MRYYVIKNHLNEKGKHIACVLAKRCVRWTGLIKSMLKKRNVVSKTNIVTLFNSFYNTMLLPRKYHIRIKSQFTSNPQAFLKGVRISDTSLKLIVV